MANVTTEYSFHRSRASTPSTLRDIVVGAGNDNTSAPFDGFDRATRDRIRAASYRASARLLARCGHHAAAQVLCARAAVLTAGVPDSDANFDAE